MADDKLKMTEKDMLKSGVLIPADFLIEENKFTIPVSPAADLGLGGGIPEGSWVGFSGPEKAGKTTLALHIAAKAQRVENGQRPTFLLDVEHRLKPMHVKGIKGLKLSTKAGDTSGLQLIRSHRDKVMSAEEFLTGATNILKTHPNAVLIIDSTSALCAAGEMVKEVSGSGRNSGPRILANFCRLMAPVVPSNNALVISIQHLIANTSGYGPSQMEDSGRKIQYQGDVKMRAKTPAKWEEEGTQVGQIIPWTVFFSALGPPGAIVTSWLRYGVGIDEVAELIDIGLDFGLISQAGAWMTSSYLMGHLEDEEVKDFMGPEPEVDKNDVPKIIKCQGRAKLYEMLSKNEKFQQLLYSDIKAMA